MGISKTNAKAGTALTTTLVTVKELVAMSEFIKNFNEKYGRKRCAQRKKK